MPLARTLRSSVRELKLHQLRPVGNAAQHPDMLVTDPAAYTRLREQLRDTPLGIEVILDQDLSENHTPDLHDHQPIEARSTVSSPTRAGH